MTQAAANAPTTPIHERLSPNARRAIFACTLIACILSTALNTILNTVLPAIMNDFAITSDTAQWLASGYTLAMAITMPLTAFLSGRFPTKPLFVGALVVFCAGVAASAFAPNFEMLMVGRIVQACGNGVIGSLAQVVLLTIFPASERGRVMGWYGLSLSAAPAIAPTLGGMAADLWGWRSVFYCALAVGVVALAASAALFRNVLDTREGTFDTASFALSALAFGGIALGIGNISSHGIASIDALAPLAVGLAAAPAFIHRQLKSDEPFLDLRILTNRTFAAATVTSMLLYLVMMGASILAPLFVQQVAGQSAAVAGLAMLPGSLCMALVSPLAGSVYDRMGIKVLLVAGGAAMVASCAAMGLVGDDFAGVVLMAALFTVRSIAIACLMMPLVTWGVGALDASKCAHGTALLSSLRTLAGAIGSAVSVGVMSSAGTAAGSALSGVHVAFGMLAALSIPLVAMGIAKSAKRKGRDGTERDA